MLIPGNRLRKVARRQGTNISASNLSKTGLEVDLPAGFGRDVRVADEAPRISSFKFFVSHNPVFPTWADSTASFGRCPIVGTGVRN